MKIAIIGRGDVLYDSAVKLHDSGYEIVCVLTAKEAPEYRRTAQDFQGLAELWKVPFAQGGKIDNHAKFLQESKADIAVSINYTGVIPQIIIDLFDNGILNAHGGDLPRYRGNACQAWALINGEERIGLCVHKMIGGELDSGDIIARDYMDVTYNTKISEVWNWMEDRTPVLIEDAIEAIAKNPNFILEQQSKDSNNALRCYPRRPEDGKINWESSAISIIRLINACNKPFAGAFCDFENTKLIVWDAELVEDNEIFVAIPGQITRTSSGIVEVACGEGKIRIRQIEVDGEVVSPDNIINSIRKRLT